jgi:hypothetical protein
MPTKLKPTPEALTTTEKLMQTFRMPRELVTFLKIEASQRGADLTSHVVRLLDGIRTWFGLPVAAAAVIEADREAMRLGRYEYLLHLVYQRGLELREKGPGFDAPGASERRKR